MILRTLSLLRSLQGASHTAQEAQATVQQACDYRWLRGELHHGAITEPSTALADGTPGVTITLAYPATRARLAGGRWPETPEERERCFVEGAHACRAAGAPAYRTLESLSRGLAEGAASVLTDAARLQYLLQQRALRLAWRRPEALPPALARRLDSGGPAADGVFLLALSVPARREEVVLNGAWLDRTLDRYRRILPRPAGR
ncbi:hypothetical protein [Halomonas sp. A11-A]|uniref:hypothetical protein n=1 Tax=Halomonas sp. A11-A TaxID=2183985 RepID=UPI000D717B68|nr:hypothetical protein [Halomonas sp. A11-A]PWV83130.1 hypothetical protein DER72_101311 [Halomonas sp. A11-A]